MAIEVSAEPSLLEAIFIFIGFIFTLVFNVLMAIAGFFLLIIGAFLSMIAGAFMALFSFVTGYGDPNTGLW